MIDNQTKQEITDALKQLNDSNVSARVSGAKKLGIIRISHPQIIERLQLVAQNDSSSDVRIEANQSLEILQPAPITNKQQNAIPQSASEDSSHINERKIIELLQKQNEIIDNLRILIHQSTEAENPKSYQLRTRIVDVDMSISSMVNLMLKWVIASIPAGIIIGFFLIVLSSCMAAL